MKKKFICTLCVAVFCSVTLAAGGAPNTSGYQDWWWNPAQSGMGVNIGQQGDTLVIAWYHFDDAGKGTYLMMSGKLDGNRLEAPFYRSTGPRPDAAYNPAQVNSTVVGTGSITFNTPDQAVFSYAYDGKTGSIDLQRFVFKKPPRLAEDGYNVSSGNYYKFGYGSVYVKNRQCDYTQGSDSYTLTIGPEAQAISQTLGNYGPTWHSARQGKNGYWLGTGTRPYQQGRPGEEIAYFFTNHYQLSKNGSPFQLDDPILTSACRYAFSVEETEQGLQGTTAGYPQGNMSCNIGPGLLSFQAADHTTVTTTVHQIRAVTNAITFDYTAKAVFNSSETQGTCEENGTVIIRRPAESHVDDTIIEVLKPYGN